MFYSSLHLRDGICYPSDIDSDIYRDLGITRTGSKDLSDYNKKSIVINYAGLSIAYLGIGLTLLLASMKIIAIQYGIIFGVFFGGSIILAYVAYLRKKEFKK